MTSQANALQAKRLRLHQRQHSFSEVFTFQPLLDCYKAICEYIGKNGEVSAITKLGKQAGAWCNWMTNYIPSSSSTDNTPVVYDPNSRSPVVQKDSLSTVASYIGVRTNQELAVKVRDFVEKELKLSNCQIAQFYKSNHSLYLPNTEVIAKIAQALYEIFKSMPEEVVIPHLKPGSQVKKALSSMIKSYELKWQQCGYIDELFSEPNKRLISSLY
jgi:hypothetical protein